ncbi:rhamnulokinase [bacterium]|nr:rhamnulokinase [bacterium]
MTPARYIAVDLGASSGRVMLADMDDTIRLTEIHRFPNHQILNLGHFQWDLLGLFHEIKQGMIKIAASGNRDITGIGVDTWGVDFGFVGRDDVLLGNPYCYRDGRTRGMMQKAFEKSSKTAMYSATGIQFMELNSVFQLLSMVESRHPVLEIAESLLFMPDLFHFMLTGERRTEYTIASTSQLLNAHARQWDIALFQQLGLPMHLMADIIPAGSIIGALKDEIKDETGLDVKSVIAPASHDTASAVAAVPAGNAANWAYVSSGTWSLLGIELQNPLINTETLEGNYTNEGGVGDTIRFLKNVPGMWFLEECRRQWQEDCDYTVLLKEAKACDPFWCLIDVDNPAFLKPANMLEAIQDHCKETGQPAPETRGQFVRCILESLALKYREVIEKINTYQQNRIEVLHVVGGGSMNSLLNQFTADALGIPVMAGPVEATALGNVLTQAMASGQLASIEVGRDLVARSFPVRDFLPENTDHWDEGYEKLKKWRQRL